MSRRRWLTAAVLVLVGLAAIYLFIRFSPFVAQDACLDGGGAWHDGACVGRRPEG